ncbi:MAG: ABC transporter substrate-binding protein [Betaproteobacteria bacterium]|nr:ABC transporter substrate-binding protein [Betaproteobacteria bacterium]
MKLPITLACGLYDRTYGLHDGSVPVEGVDLNFLPMMPVETFRRQGRHAEFDASEFSLSTFLVLHARGDRRFVGIPVYPSRRYRHEHVWINAHAGIRTPHDLKGKRVGVQEFVQTAALWIRGFLEHDYGVRTQDVDWYFGGYNEPDPHFKPRIEMAMPANVRTQVIAGDTCIDAMLDRGEIDAVLPALPASFRRGSPNVARLFPDFRAAEEDYFRRTRIFPIMHVVVIRRELYEQNRWVAQALYKAFVRAKELAIRRLTTSPPLHATLPWLTEHIEATQRVMGRDYWSYGLEQNRHVLETAARHAWEQGMLEKPIARIDELFAPETHAGVLELPP